MPRTRIVRPRSRIARSLPLFLICSIGALHGLEGQDAASPDHERLYVLEPAAEAAVPGATARLRTRHPSPLGATAGPVDFALPDGSTLTFRRSASPIPAVSPCESWHGTPDGSPNLDRWVLVTVCDDLMAATIRDGSERWSIRPEPGGLHGISRVDSAALPPLCGLPDEEPSAVSSLDALGPDGWSIVEESNRTADLWAQGEAVGGTAAGSTATAELRFGESRTWEALGSSEVVYLWTYDLAILYTEASSYYAGGPAVLATVVQHMADYANLAYANSGLPLAVRLISLDPVRYSESGDIARDLAVLKGDGSVKKHAKAIGADAVMLLVNFSSNAQGIAGLPFYQNPKALKADAFSVALWYGDTLLLAHEVGHNFGAQHDYLHAASIEGNMFPFGYGHWVDGSFRTVMSYFDQCFYCPDYPVFSTHFFSVGPYPAGIENVRENAKVLALNSALFANIRGSGQPPAPPKGLKRTLAEPDALTVAWKSAVDPEAFGIFVSDLHRWYFLGFLQPQYREVRVYNLLPGTKYKFQVYAVTGAGGFSKGSNTASAKTRAQ